MNMQLVSSSTIHAIGYDFGSRDLDVQFKSKGGPGAVYRYADVPRASYDALVRAESIGKFFAAHIKPHFKATRLEQEKAK